MKISFIVDHKMQANSRIKTRQDKSLLKFLGEME